MDFCKDIDAFYIDTVCEPWPGLYTNAKASISRALELRAARGRARRAPPPPRRRHRRELLRRQPRHGVLDGQAGAARRRPRHRRDGRRAQDPRGLGPADAAPRRQGHPHRRARHPARARAQAARRVRQHLVGRGLLLRRPAALRARLGHAREAHAGERPPPRFRLRRRDLPDPAGRRHPGALLDPDRAGPARLPGDPQRVRSRSPTTSRCARTARPSTGRPATTPTTRATTRCCRCTRWPARPGSAQPDVEDPRRERDRRRHRRARRAALRPRQERLLVRLAALDRGDAASSRPIRTPPACR